VGVRRRASKALVAAVCGGFFVAAPVVVAAPASACPIGHLADPITGQCFVANSGVPTVGGIPCIPASRWAPAWESFRTSHRRAAAPHSADPGPSAAVGNGSRYSSKIATARVQPAEAA